MQQSMTRPSIKKLLHEMKLRTLSRSKVSLPLSVSSEASSQFYRVVEALWMVG